MILHHTQIKGSFYSTWVRDCKAMRYRWITLTENHFHHQSSTDNGTRRLVVLYDKTRLEILSRPKAPKILNDLLISSWDSKISYIQQSASKGFTKNYNAQVLGQPSCSQNFLKFLKISKKSKKNQKDSKRIKKK